jgi:hypothetical protein
LCDGLKVSVANAVTLGFLNVIIKTFSIYRRRREALHIYVGFAVLTAVVKKNPIFCLKTEATCSSETSVDFQRTKRRYIPEDRTRLFTDIFSVDFAFGV